MATSAVRFVSQSCCGYAVHSVTVRADDMLFVTHSYLRSEYPQNTIDGGAHRRTQGLPNLDAAHAWELVLEFLFDAQRGEVTYLAFLQEFSRSQTETRLARQPCRSRLYRDDSGAGRDSAVVTRWRRRGSTCEDGQRKNRRLWSGHSQYAGRVIVQGASAGVMSHPRIGRSGRPRNSPTSPVDPEHQSPECLRRCTVTRSNSIAATQSSHHCRHPRARAQTFAQRQY